MAYKRISPQPVTEGGTGISSNTAYTVLCGGTTATGAIQNVSSVGTDTYVLTSNGAGALPTFQLSNVHNSVFVSRVGSTITNVTGDGTVYTIIFGTEEYDRNGDYNNATGVYTAPVTGMYYFQTTVYATGIISGHNVFNVLYNNSSGDKYTGCYNIGYAMSVSGNMSINSSLIVNMTAAQTMSVSLTVSGSTKVVDVVGGAATGGASRFTGFLMG